MDNTFFERFSALCKEHKETPNSIAKIIGSSSGSVTAWKKGTAPRNATLSKIADYFGVTTDYLLGKENKKAPTEKGEHLVDMSDVDIAFYGGYKALTEEQQEAVRRMVQVMREQRKD